MASASHPFFSLDQQGLVRIAAVAPPVHIADPGANLAEHWRLIDAAEAQGAALVLFPELSLTGYAIDDLHLQAVVIAAAEQALASLVADSARYEAVLVVGLPVRAMGGLFNTAAVVL
ncbi:MAG: nitrilase-related carbon-nitrogen hydrolase, partial [Asticcacaulis sp.]